jgi:predicted O-methyltransferase YrrM
MEGRAVRAAIDRLVLDGTVVARSDGTTHEIFPVAIGVAEGEALREWVNRERAWKTLEIGLGYAVSTLYICEGLLHDGASEVQHIAIDPFQHERFADCGLQVLQDAGIRGLVVHHPAGSQVVLPRLAADGTQFDLAFVDGNHRFDAVFVDLFYLGRLIRPGGVVFLDDYQLPAIRRAAAYYLSNLGWSLEEVSTSDSLHHWAVLRTSRRADDRPFDYFVNF